MSQSACILGAGPVGLDCALHALQKGMEVTVMEKSQWVGGNLARWGHVQLFSPNRLNISKAMEPVVGTSISPEAHPTGDEYRQQVLEPVRQHLEDKGVRIITSCRALNIGRIDHVKMDMKRSGKHPFKILAETGEEEKLFGPFDYVFDCTGCYGHWAHAGMGGIPAIGEQKARKHGKLRSEIPATLEKFEGKHVVIIGNDHSAATVLRNFGQGKHGTPASIHWITRRHVDDSVTEKSGIFVRHLNDPLPERDALARYANAVAAKSKDPTLKHDMKCPIKHIVGWLVEVQSKYLILETNTDLYPSEIPYDVIFSMTGHRVDNELARELHYHQCFASEGSIAMAEHHLHRRGSKGDPLKQAVDPSAVKTQEPQFFVVGAKTFARDPNFLLKTGFDQVQKIFDDI